MVNSKMPDIKRVTTLRSDLVELMKSGSVRVRLTGVSGKGKNRLKEVGTDIWEILVADWITPIPEEQLFLMPTEGSTEEKIKHSRWIRWFDDPDFAWEVQ